MSQAASTIIEMASKVNAKNLVLYPYAHLSSDLSSPNIAVEVLKDLREKIAAEGDFDTVVKAPFGWYKSFTLKCKGHPMSELSRHIEPEIGGEYGKKAKGETREEITAQVESRFIVLTPDGAEHDFDPDDPASLESLDCLEHYPSLRKFILAEEIKGQPKGSPPSVKAMQRLELIDYEEISDAGHFRLYPKGYFMFKLLEELSRQVCTDGLEALEIDTPIMYDWESPDVRGQGGSFHERHYIIPMPEEKKEYVLRFAGDFGLFRMMKDATISYKQLPIRVFEFSKSFRKEQRGELSGLKRLRAFHMPDLHSFSLDLGQGWEEYKAIYKAFVDMTAELDIEYTISFRVVEEFYEKYKENLRELLDYGGTAGMIEVLSERRHYWVVKNEIQGIDAGGGNLQLGTVQLDVEDAERYGITYMDEHGEPQGCIICHSSIGSIERWIYELLEEALKKEKPAIPFWISPTQVRLIPVGDEFLPDCREIAESMEGRVDIDDRDESVGKKVREAEREWIPMIIVYGDREKESGRFKIRTREGEDKEMDLEELKALVADKNKDWPYMPLPLPMMVSKRIKFRG